MGAIVHKPMLQFYMLNVDIQVYILKYLMTAFPGIHIHWQYCIYPEFKYHSAI